jgi:hypothetical protein
LIALFVFKEKETQAFSHERAQPENFSGGKILTLG